MNQNDEVSSFLSGDKEPEMKELKSIKDRLIFLIRDRSRRQAAKDWGVAYSTLKNYIDRGSIPRSSNLEKIANCEGVEQSWILFGSEMNSPENREHQLDTKPIEKRNSRETWDLLFNMIGEDKSNALLRAILNKGVDATLLALDVVSKESSDTETVFAAIDALPIKRTLKQAIKMGVLVNNEDADREILQILEKAERAQSPDSKALEMPEPKRNNG